MARHFISDPPRQPLIEPLEQRAYFDLVPTIVGTLTLSLHDLHRPGGDNFGHSVLTREVNAWLPYPF